MKKLKNWWFLIAYAVGGVLDVGFDVFNPILIDIGLSKTTIGIIKAIFVVYGIVKIKLSVTKTNRNMTPLTITLNWDLVGTEEQEDALDTWLAGRPVGATLNQIGTRPKQRPK